MVHKESKASVDVLNLLHNRVAQTLLENLDDPKVLSQAIKFLKDNEITADIMESDSLADLTQTIKAIANDPNDKRFSVEDMLN